MRESAKMPFLHFSTQLSDFDKFWKNKHTVEMRGEAVREYPVEVANLIPLSVENLSFIEHWIVEISKVIWNEETRRQVWWFIHLQMIKCCSGQYAFWTFRTFFYSGFWCIKNDSWYFSFRNFEFWGTEWGWTQTGMKYLNSATLNSHNLIG